MKQIYPAVKVRYYSSLFVIAATLALYNNTADAQSCPLNSVTQINSLPNTFFPADQANVAAGDKKIKLGAATYGSTAISAGDILLVIQMQGAQINSNNTSSYGDGTGTGSGYLNNGNLLAGNMEYVVASNSVSLSGGTLHIVSGLSNSYQNTPFGSNGQYTYQVVRVPVYYDVQLTGSITAPRWNGASGGMIVLYATDNIDMNGYTLDASGLGFRGGGGRAFTGAGSGSNADFITLATNNANGGKGEGIAGTPKYLNNNNTFLDVSTYEGYPNGSYGKGAPGNGGGGGTDGNPRSNNDENTGGGGGSNGGVGGIGGNSWNSNLPTGGRGGAVFNQTSPSRLVMGGGGGAGTTNNATGTPNNGFASSGAAGGGIIIVTANNTISGSGSIKSNGGPANNTVQNDGSGGGGGGGSIIIFSKNGSLSTLNASAKGGNGGSNQGGGGDAHGPGGGGGGGIIYSNVNLNSASSVGGGGSGRTSGGTSTYGAAAGANGVKTQTMTQSQMPQFPLSCVVLAMNFLDITAAQADGLTTVRWQVSGEASTLEYIVERSVDGSTFTGIGHVPYQVRTSTTNQYELTDKENISGTGVVYYRIREIEVSGKEQYSKIVTVKMNGLTAKLTVFPNPARTSATVSFVATSNGDVSLRLFDLKGSEVWQKQYRISAGANSILIDQLFTLPNGLYILQWFDGLKPQQVKLMVNH